MRANLLSVAPYKSWVKLVRFSPHFKTWNLGPGWRADYPKVDSQRAGVPALNPASPPTPTEARVLDHGHPASRASPHGSPGVSEPERWVSRELLGSGERASLLLHHHPPRDPSLTTRTHMHICTTAHTYTQTPHADAHKYSCRYTTWKCTQILRNTLIHTYPTHTHKYIDTRSHAHPSRTHTLHTTHNHT